MILYTILQSNISLVRIRISKDMRHFFYLIFLFTCMQSILFSTENELELVGLLEESKDPPLATNERNSIQSSDTSIQEEVALTLPSSLALLPIKSEENVISWLDNDVINKRVILSKSLNNFLFIFSAGSAIARGSVYFILGYNLSENLLVPSLHNSGHYVISSLYAAAASIPMTILGTKSSHKFLEYLITPTSQNFIAIKREELCHEKALNVSRNILLGGAAACSASILTSIAYFSFNDLIGWFWLVPGIPTFYVRTLIDYYAIIQIGEAVYDKLISAPKNKKLSISHPDSRGADIYTIREALNKSKSYINALNYNQAKILEEIIKNPEESLDKKIGVCVQPELFLDDAEEVVIKKSNAFRDCMGYLGSAIAVGGMYLYYKDTREGFSFVQPLFHLNDQESLNAKASLAIISLVTASSLSAIAAQSSTLKFYDLITDLSNRLYKYTFFHQNEVANFSTLQTREDRYLQRKRIAVASFAFMLACCDALTLYQVAILQSLNMRDPANIFALISSCVSLFTMSFWAVDEGIMDYIKGGEPKARMLGIIDHIDSTLPLISDSALKSLRNILPSASFNPTQA